MALMPWAEFFPDVLPSAPGCPAPVVEHYLRLASIRLCEKSKRLKFDLPAFPTAATVFEYDLAPGTDVQSVTILDGTIDGIPMEPLRRDELAGVINWQTEQGLPTRYLMVENTDTVRLWKTPDAVYQVSLTLAIKPSKTAAGIEDWFGHQYRDGIAAGALAQILAVAKKPWTDLETSAFKDAAFKREISTASADAARDATRAPLRTQRVVRV